MSWNLGGHSKLLAVICCMLFVLFTANIAFAQTSVFGHLPENGWQKSKLSQAVLNDAEQANIQMLAARQSGTLTSDVAENAAESLKVVFDHFQEIGLNEAMQNKLLSNQKTFFDYHPNSSQIDAVESKLAAMGLHVSDSQVRSVMDPSLEERQKFLSTVQSVGLYQTELMLVAQLRARAEQLSVETNVGEQLGHLSTGSARLVEVITPVCGSCFIIWGLTIFLPALAPAGFGSCLTCALGG